jgi:hypothetical protein
MVHYVGCITEPAESALEGADQSDTLTAVGYDMDNGRRLTFRASTGALRAWYADHDEDAYLVVEEEDVMKVTGRYGRDLWSNAGLPWSIG